MELSPADDMVVDKSMLVLEKEQNKIIGFWTALSRRYREINLMMIFTMACFGFLTLGMAHEFYSQCDLVPLALNGRKGVCNSMMIQKPFLFILFSSLGHTMIFLLTINQKLTSDVLSIASSTLRMHPSRIEAMWGSVCTTATIVELMWSTVVLQAYCSEEEASITNTSIHLCESLRVYVWIAFIWSLGRVLTR